MTSGRFSVILYPINAKRIKIILELAFGLWLSLSLLSLSNTVMAQDVPHTLFLPVMVRLVKASPLEPLDTVMIGREGWLYYTGDRSIQDYQGLEQLTQEYLALIDAKLTRLKERLGGRGIDFVVAIAPDKHTIYPEYLPESIQKVQPGTRLDQIMTYNQEHAGAPVLDLRVEMLQRKQAEVVYYRTDSHWNDLGAYYAYSAIMNVLAPQYPALAPHSLSDYTISRREVTGRGLAELISLQFFFSDEMVTLEPHYLKRALPAAVTFEPEDSMLTFARAIDDPSLPTAVIFRDSFSTALIPFFEEHFRRVVFVWSMKIDYELIDHEQPDVVIVEVVERKAGALDQ